MSVALVIGVARSINIVLENRLISFITPTGLVLATLSMVDVTYDKWLKFIMPLMGIITFFSAAMLVFQVIF